MFNPFRRKVAKAATKPAVSPTVNTKLIKATPGGKLFKKRSDDIAKALSSS